MVLDALNYIKDAVDGTLAFRWSGRMGVCGSCGMRANDITKLTCSAFLCDYYPNPIRIEPLRHCPVERDLVIVLDDFLEKLRAIEPWVIREDEQPLDAGEYRQTPTQLADYKQFSQCINCLLCMDACPIPEWEERFLGPAASPSHDAGTWTPASRGMRAARPHGVNMGSGLRLRWRVQRRVSQERRPCGSDSANEAAEQHRVGALLPPRTDARWLPPRQLSA